MLDSEHNFSDSHAINMTLEERVTLNVGGTNFTTNTATLKTIPDSVLASISKDSGFYDKTDNVFYFDRDSEIFSHVLNAYRTGSLHIPSNRCSISVEVELDFWRIPREILSECCWKTFYQSKGDLETISKLKEASSFEFGLARNTVGPESCHESQSTKEKIWLFLEEPKSSKAATVWQFVYGFVVILSSLAFLMWTDLDLRVTGYMPSYGEMVDKELFPYINVSVRVLTIIFTDPHPVLFSIDVLCIVFFFVECIVHVAVSPSKCAFFRTAYNVINLVLVCIMLIAISMEITRGLFQNDALYYIFYILKTCTVFRLLLLFKLSKLYSGLKVLLLAMRESYKELLLLVVCYAIAVVIFGGLMFCTDIEANSFDSIFTAMWWALITMTTIGYGDYYPTVIPSYIVGVFCATLGIVILALPIAIIASNFSDFYQRNDEMERHLEAIKKETPRFKQQQSIESLETDKATQLHENGAYKIEAEEMEKYD